MPYSEITVVGMVDPFDSSQFAGKNFCELFLDSVSKWEKAGGRREGEWLKEFEKSEQYTEYVDEILKQLGNPNVKTWKKLTMKY